MEHTVGCSRQRRRALARQAAAKSSRKGALFASGAATLGVLATGVPLEAAVFNVTNLNDAGAGSLRQAILDANGAAGADTVTFQAGLTGVITLTSGQLAVTDSLDIQGPGAGTLAVDGNNSSRVFYLYNGSAVLDITISGLTISGGSANIGAGVVDFDENLTLDGVTITGNDASGDGGGLWADGFNMNLIIRDSVISGNTSGDDGGGIYVEDTGGLLQIQRTAITGNDAAGSGGGVYFYDPDDTISIEDSTISGNSAGGLGGGIYLYSHDSGEFNVRGTTVSGNDAAAGGGLFLYSPDHGGSIENSTVSGNQATSGNGGGIYLYNLYNFSLHHVTVTGNSASGSGGGVYFQSGDLPIDNSIVADNTAGSDADLGNGAGVSFSLAFSLVETPGAAAINDNGGNVFNQDPQLGPLQNNGGPTLTQLPASSSPAVNAGNSAFVVDQRGQARPVGAAVDMGAVEVNPGTIQLTVSSVSVDEGVGTVTITATRTGGTDGAVSVSFATSPGTAVSPDDFAAAAGSLNWANQDGADKSFQVTIVNDTLDEADETFTASLSAPTGGAALGGITTETVTILDNDEPQLLVVPTLGEAGKVLLGGLVALAGFLLLRRRKGIAASVVVLSLTLGAVAASSASASEREQKAVTLAQLEVAGEQATIRLSDGTTIVVALKDLEVKDRRQAVRRGKSGTGASVKALSTGQAVAVKLRRGSDGQAKKVKIQIFDDLEQAQASQENKD